MKYSQILGFLIIYVSLSILKISSKSETWSPEPVRFGMEHTLYKQACLEPVEDKLKINIKYCNK